MERVKFDPKELEPVGYYQGFNPKAPPTPVYNFPISRKENFELLLKGEQPLWMPHSNEIYLFCPSCVPDSWSRAMVSAFRPTTPDELGGKDMFGVEWEFVPQVGGSMVRPGNAFVKDLDHWEDYVKMPDFDSWDWEGCAKESEETRKDGRMVKVPLMTGLFERLISFIDMTDAMISLIDEDSKPAVHRLFDAICNAYDKLFEKYETYFHPDFVWFHDDWGSQRAPFFSTATVREMIAPYLKRCVESAHKHGMIFELHSCGAIEDLVPVMIECGVDIWNGQEMNDKVKIAKLYGDKIIIDSQPKDIPADAPIEVAEANMQEYINNFKGLRSYTNRAFGEHPMNYQLHYSISRKAFNE